MEIRVCKDYYDELYKKYPEVPKKDIDKIVKFGWKSVYLHSSYGGDILIKDKDFWCYLGNLKKNALDWYHYYIKKLIIKIKVLYKRKKKQWDGYYYFALDNVQYQDYLKKKNKKGRPFKWFTFNNILLYEIFDECSLDNHEKQYFFRIPYISYIRSKFFCEKLKTDKAEFYMEREPLKFEDVLITEHKYDVL